MGRQTDGQILTDTTSDREREKKKTVKCYVRQKEGEAEEDNKQDT